MFAFWVARIIIEIMPYNTSIKTGVNAQSAKWPSVGVVVESFKSAKRATKPAVIIVVVLKLLMFERYELDLSGFSTRL